MGSAVALAAQATALVISCGDSYSDPGSVALVVLSIAVLSAGAGCLSWLVARYDHSPARAVLVAATGVVLVVIAALAGYIGIVTGFVQFGPDQHVMPRNVGIISIALGGAALVALVACVLPHVRRPLLANAFLQGWIVSLALLVAHGAAVVAAADALCG